MFSSGFCVKQLYPESALNDKKSGEVLSLDEGLEFSVPWAAGDTVPMGTSNTVPLVINACTSVQVKQHIFDQVKTQAKLLTGKARR